ncbi:heme A synthase [Bacillaceae bacterium S4-13-58]
MLKFLKILSVITTIGMVFVLIGGALVTKTESGMGCGSSWPLCNGEIIPSNITTELVIEFSHRAASGFVGISLLILSYLAWKYIGHIRETKILVVLSLMFLILQGLIGAAAVVWGQSDFVLAMHFGISLISFATIFILMLLIFEIDLKFDAQSLHIHKSLRKQFYGLTIYTLIVVYTGALVRHTSASLACSNWPLCGIGISSWSFYEWVQMGHRLAAGLLFIWVTILLFKVSKSYKNSKVMYYGWWAAFGLIFLQVILGGLIIFTKLNLIIALLHAFIISCFFGLLSYFLLLSSRSARSEKNQ